MCLNPLCEKLSRAVPFRSRVCGARSQRSERLDSLNQGVQPCIVDRLAIPHLLGNREEFAGKAKEMTLELLEFADGLFKRGIAIGNARPPPAFRALIPYELGKVRGNAPAYDGHFRGSTEHADEPVERVLIGLPLPFALMTQPAFAESLQYFRADKIVPGAYWRELRVGRGMTCNSVHADSFSNGDV